RKQRPGRTLAILGVGVVILYILAYVAGTVGLPSDNNPWKPRLGLDLEGGTRITLTAVGDSKDITPAKLRQAASIVESRANGSGVSEASVSTQGNRNIVVEIPGKNAQNLVDSVKRTAQLRFRLVAGQPQPGNVKPSASPSPSIQPGSVVTEKPAAGNKKTPTAEPTASPNPRPAPAFALKGVKQDDPTPSSAPVSPSPIQVDPAQVTPQLTEKGADITKPLEWTKDPGTEWLTKFAAFQCPKKGTTEKVEDDPNQPLIACDDKGQKYLLSVAIIEGTDVKTASYGTPQGSTGWAVTLKIRAGKPAKTFGKYSQAMAGSDALFAQVLDGQVISAATFISPILDGNAQITGDFSEAEARSLANSLKFGALPLQFESTVEVVGATLAGNQLTAGIWAGVIGLILVMVYCLLYYRGLGIVVIASLVVAGVITYAMVLILARTAGFTLTLPGIAGLIVAVGITADSFIVYFERIRDEMRMGKSMRVAVESGWIKARNTCLAADAVSFLAAVVLFIFAIGVVKGFAFTLGLSTVIDVAVFFWFTKPMVSLLARFEFFNSGHKYSGLSDESLGIDAKPVAVGGNA
ncbi:MAG TPA: protein translocase subunit SecD, partial [Marmoricola sp.]|nr:protein translocase subunit SecD [Marmoricola sp.]